MFETQRDLVVYIHHLLMRPHEDTVMARAFQSAVIRYAIEHELDDWIAEALGHEGSHT